MTNMNTIFPKQLSEEAVTEKAGGVIVRTTEQGEKELCLVYRSRYNDWSVPKGHIDAGETRVQAAIREVGEETGLYCAVLRELPPFFYTTPTGEQVVTYFFEMNCLEQRVAAPRHDDEVDAVEWKPLEEALQIISYPSLCEYLHSLLLEKHS